MTIRGTKKELARAIYEGYSINISLSKSGKVLEWSRTSSNANFNNTYNWDSIAQAEKEAIHHIVCLAENLYF